MAKYEEKVKQSGCHYRFASSRGPLNIASFLFGTTDFMMALAVTPDEAQKALTVITDFVIDWLELQYEKFPDIRGCLCLMTLWDSWVSLTLKLSCCRTLNAFIRHSIPEVGFFHNDAAGPDHCRLPQGNRHKSF